MGPLPSFHPRSSVGRAARRRTQTPVAPAPKPVQPPAPDPDWPDLSAYLQVPLAAIHIPRQHFLKSPPNKNKTKTLREAVKVRCQLDQLDQPLAVRVTEDGTGYVLVDGYRRYVVAQHLRWPTVPVVIQGIDRSVGAARTGRPSNSLSLSRPLA